MEPDHPSRAAPEAGSVSELIPQLCAGQASVPGAAAEMKPRVGWVQIGPQDTRVPFLSPLCPQSEGAGAAQQPRRLCPGSRGAGRGRWEFEAGAPPSQLCPLLRLVTPARVAASRVSSPLGLAAGN